MRASATSVRASATPADAYREEAALQSICASSMQNIEADMASVSSLLRDDPDAAGLVANLIAPRQ